MYDTNGLFTPDSDINITIVLMMTTYNTVLSSRNIFFNLDNIEFDFTSKNNNFIEENKKRYKSMYLNYQLLIIIVNYKNFAICSCNFLASSAAFSAKSFSLEA